ncbi:MAG: hypothetical protein JO025_25015 [Verrucomicrobia bacterium]|nr:hypothetical protein [Verrucomicrobiota bacterium]
MALRPCCEISAFVFFREIPLLAFVSFVIFCAYLYIGFWAMYLNEFDPSQRLLKITAIGDTTVEEIRSALENLRSLLNGVQPGFRLLADLSGLVSMSTSAAPHLGEIMELCAEKGVALVVRLLPPDPSKDIGLTIISQFHYPPEVPILTCATMEEALHLLEEKTEPNQEEEKNLTQRRKGKTEGDTKNNNRR